MSKSNYNNRVELSMLLGAVSADKKVVALAAQKKMRIHSLEIVDTDAQAAHASNYLEYQAIKEDSAVGTAVSNTDGVAARVPVALDLDGDYIELEKGEILEVNVNVEGTGAGTMLTIVGDIEVIGN